MLISITTITKNTRTQAIAGLTCVHQGIASQSLPPGLEGVLVQPPWNGTQMRQHGTFRNEREVERKVPASKQDGAADRYVSDTFQHKC
jgi:hypothetical protein